MSEHKNTNTGGAGNITPESGGNTTPGTGEKTFTQAEVNAIVGERLSKERGKIETDLSKREQEIALREFELAAREVLEKRHFANNGAAMDLLGVLKASNADELNKALDVIEKAMGRQIIQLGAEVGSPPAGTSPNADARIRAAMGLKKG